KNVIRSEVFESGKYLFGNEDFYNIREVTTDDKPDEDYLKQVTENTHKTTVNEIKVLFRIFEKIKQLRQYLPHYRLGKVFYTRNFLPEAMDNFKRVVELNPKFVRGYQRLGQACLQAGQPEQALDAFKKAYALHPEYPDINNALGVTYTALNNLQMASRFFKESLKLKDDFKEANFNLGVVLFLSTLDEKSKDDRVIIPARFMRSYKEISEDPRYGSKMWELQFERTNDALDSGKRDVVVEKVLELQKKILCFDDSGDVMDLFFLQFMYGGQEIDNDGIQHFTEMINEEVEQHQNYADYWNELGIIHLIQCREYFLKALSEFEKSKKSDPNFQAAQKNTQLLQRGKKGFLILLRAILK
ncbi:MAG TPA: tetratricopeptide repeat protein, partial [Caldithrix abyssi]|nr:tetratricopeptide repeat protein [Caldithrix abyssi]